MHPTSVYFGIRTIFERLLKGTWQTALDCLERTLAAEPDYAEAAASLASIQMDGYLNAFGFDETALVRAEKLARHAIDINPLSQMGWFQLGIVHFYKRENDRALKAFEHTLALNPNSPFLLAPPDGEYRSPANGNAAES